MGVESTTNVIDSLLLLIDVPAETMNFNIKCVSKYALSYLLPQSALDNFFRIPMPIYKSFKIDTVQCIIQEL